MGMPPPSVQRVCTPSESPRTVAGAVVGVAHFALRARSEALEVRRRQTVTLMAQQHDIVSV